MTIPASYIEGLERALARVIGEARAEGLRQIELLSARADAAIAKLEARNAELEARLAGIDAALDQRVSCAVMAGVAEIAASVPAAPEPRDWAPEIEAAVAECRAAIPAMPDLSGLATRAEVEALRMEIPEPRDWMPEIEAAADAVASTIPAPADLSGLATKAELDALRSGIPQPPELLPAPDLSGFATKEELDALREEIRAQPEPRDWTPEIGVVAAAVDAAKAEVKDLAQGLTEEVSDRLSRHPGRMPTLREWADGVHYAGDIVVHSGATWQATRDTGRAPPHDDWLCIAAKGDAGADGRSFAVRGTWDGEAEYRALDVVMSGGSSFVAKRDNPGSLPGDGWQLAASAGGRGRAGDRGEPGPCGPAAPAITDAGVSDDGIVTLTCGDGSAVEFDLYPLLSRLR